MLFVLNVMTICHTHHLSTELLGENLTLMHKYTPRNTEFVLQYNYRMPKITFNLIRLNA